MQSSSVLLTTGTYATVSVGDVVVVRTPGQDKHAFVLPASEGRYRVYVLRLTELESNAKDSLVRGIGCFFSNPQRSLEVELIADPIADVSQLRLHNTTVAVLGKGAIEFLSMSQLADVMSGIDVVN